MPLLGAPDSVYGNRRIECDELPVMSHGECKQVDIGELARSMNAGRIGDLRIEQADVVGPELMERARARLRQALHDRPHR